jgi:hypothetical protein
MAAISPARAARSLRTSFRKKETVGVFLRSIPLKLRASIERVCTDMYEGYTNAARKFSCTLMLRSASRPCISSRVIVIERLSSAVK